MKNKAKQHKISVNGMTGLSAQWGTYTTKHTGGLWRWTACNPQGETNDGIATNKTAAENAAKQWLGVKDV